MAAYYNEIDPFAVQWLRNLIAAGHIADGEVDNRSIEDVRPIDLMGFTQCHFFAGIGFWADADWLGCKDGKFWPVEPGTFPLVDGATARVGRLRGYGNAIVAPLAAEFIKAYMKVRE